jgi:hypothetical protein
MPGCIIDEHDARGQAHTQACMRCRAGEAGEVGGSSRGTRQTRAASRCVPRPPAPPPVRLPHHTSQISCPPRNGRHLQQLPHLHQHQLAPPVSWRMANFARSGARARRQRRAARPSQAAPGYCRRRAVRNSGGRPRRRRPAPPLALLPKEPRCPGQVTARGARGVRPQHALRAGTAGTGARPQPPRLRTSCPSGRGAARLPGHAHMCVPTAR